MNGQQDKLTWAEEKAIGHLGRVKGEAAEIASGADETTRSRVDSLLKHHDQQLAALLTDAEHGAKSPLEFDRQLADLEAATLDEAQELALSDYQRKIAAAAGMNLSDYAREYRKAVRRG